MSKDFKEQKKQLMISYAKQEIIDSVVDLLEQQGVNQLTMAQVAKKAGIAKGTLYSYFDNKDDLVESTIQNSLEPLMMAEEEIINSDLPPDEKLKKIAGFHLSFFEEHKNYFRVLIYEHHRSHDPKNRFMDNRYQKFLKRISKVIQDGMDQGIFRPFSARLIAVTFSETLIGVTLQNILHEDDCDMKEAQKTIIGVLFNGIKTD